MPGERSTRGVEGFGRLLKKIGNEEIRKEGDQTNPPDEEDSESEEEELLRQCEDYVEAVSDKDKQQRKSSSDDEQQDSIIEETSTQKRKTTTKRTHIIDSEKTQGYQTKKARTVVSVENKINSVKTTSSSNNKKAGGDNSKNNNRNSFLEEEPDDKDEETEELYLEDKPVKAWRNWGTKFKERVHEILLGHVFPFTKFVDNVNDLDVSPYMAIIFEELGRDERDNMEHKAFRSKYWESIAKCTKEKISMLRNNVLAECRKMMIGKSIFGKDRVLGTTSVTKKLVNATHNYFLMQSMTNTLSEYETDENKTDMCDMVTVAMDKFKEGKVLTATEKEWLTRFYAMIVTAIVSKGNQKKFKANQPGVKGYQLVDIVTNSDEGFGLYAWKLYGEGGQDALCADTKTTPENTNKGTDENADEDKTITKVKRMDVSGRMRVVQEKKINQLKTTKINSCNEAKRSNLMYYAIACNYFEEWHEEVENETEKLLDTMVREAMLETDAVQEEKPIVLVVADKENLVNSTGTNKMNYMRCGKGPHRRRKKLNRS